MCFRIIFFFPVFGICDCKNVNYLQFFILYMAIEDAIKKLEISNQGLNVILENLDEQLADIRLDPRLEGLIDDLENLFFAYLKTWIKTNTEIIDILKKEKK